jgi:glyoxylase-like metal-dependent hydrolase (beta-lactamase superfamily II)
MRLGIHHATLLAILIMLVAPVNARGGEVERLYVIDCGFAHAEDQSKWSPGVNADVPIDFSDNCYLIRHSSEGYLLWDTGITDRLTALPQGQLVPPLRQTWYRQQTLVSTLAAIGVAPGDVRYVAISHNHPDHVGNLDAFPNATVVMQRSEWEAAMALPQKPFSAEHKTELIEGDKDLFGDGSLTILSTPGHTVGHQSLLVHLRKTGYVVLTGDAVHFQSNWDHRRVPAFNADREKTLASMDKLARVVDEKHAQLWINHDKPSSDARAHAPAFYE